VIEWHCAQASGKLMLAANDREKRQSIIDACLRMNALAINRAQSGNISLRHEGGMLITADQRALRDDCSPSRLSIGARRRVRLDPAFKWNGGFISTFSEPGRK